MENNRGQSIFLSVVGIATLLVAIIGATFAYFSITVTGNDTASSIYVRTAQVGGVTFDGTGAGIVVTNAYPGWHDSKQFTIKTDDDTDPSATVQYTIELVVDQGQLASTATSGEFVYSLTPSSVGGENAAITDANVPATTTTIATGTLTGSMTHTYTFEMEILEKGTEQNHLQGKLFEGKIQVNVSTAQGLRTWDDQTSNWKPYTVQQGG